MKNNSISELMAAPWKIRVIFTAIELNIFSLLSDKTLDAEELAAQCEAVSHQLKPLLDALVSMDLLHFRDNAYRNTEFSQTHLVEGQPHYLGDLVQLHADESRHWEKLIDIIRGSRKRRSEDDRYRTFIKAMDNLGRLGEADALINSVDLTGKSRMVDAGGGSGLYSIALLRQYPELVSTILDRKETLDITRELIAPYPEKDRIRLKEADITRDVFDNGQEVILLSDVVYEEDTARTILKNARNSLHDSGILIIRGYYSDPDNTRPLFGALFALGQLVFDSGRKVMTISSLQKNVLDAGFDIEKMTRLTERSFLLVARKWE